MLRVASLVLLLLGFVFGWVVTFGGAGNDIFRDVVALSGGGFVLVGSTTSGGAGGSDVWLVRIDEDGEVVWEETYGGSYDDEAYAAAVLDGRLIVVGSTRSFGEGTPGYSNVYILEVDPAGGELLGYHVAGGDMDDAALGVAAGDDIAAIVGYTWTSGSRDEGYVLFFSDSVDSELVFGGLSNDGFRAVAYSDGRWVAAGYTKSLGEGTPAYSNALVVWDFGVQYAVGEGGTDEASGVAFTPSGECVVVGRKQGDAGLDLWVFEVDDDGAVHVSATSGGVYNESGQDVAVADDGFVVVGFSNSPGTAGYDDVYIVKFGTDGSLQWSRTYGGTGNDYAYAICPCGDGYIVAGATMSFGEGGFDGYVLRISSEGDTTTDAVASKSLRPENETISVYPNPFNDACTISVSPRGGMISVFDAHGRVVDRLWVFGGSVRWTPGRLPSGVYRIRCGSAEAKAVFVK